MVRSKVGSLPMHTCVRVCTHRCTHARNVMAHIVCDRGGGWCSGVLPETCSTLSPSLAPKSRLPVDLHVCVHISLNIISEDA